MRRTLLRLAAVVVALAALAPVRARALAESAYWDELALRPEQVRPDSLYAELPDVAKCREGALRPIEREKILRAVNAVRALHRLPPVSYDPRSESFAAKAALIMGATGVMTHFPERNAACSSSDGRTGSAQSNLYLGTFPSGLVPSSESMVAGWMKDLGVPQLGHRRWLLDPYLDSVSFGRVDAPGTSRSAGALRVFTQIAGAPFDMGQDFVAWPMGNYPAFLWDRRADWSVSIYEESANKFDSQFGYFDRATIEVRDEETNRPMDVSRVTRDSQGFGVPNALMWKVGGVQPNHGYKVRVSNVATKAGGTRELEWRVYIDDKPPSRNIERNGLTWERKTPTNTNDTFTLGDAKRYCSGLRGRLPTLPELQGLVVKGAKFAIDVDTFANVSETQNYWTATPWNGGAQYQNVVAFWNGGVVYQQPGTMAAAVMCVLEGAGK